MFRKEVLFFLIGFIFSQKVVFFGEFFVGEILCGLLIVLNLKRIYIPRNFKTILLLLFLWFLAQIVSDLINKTILIKSLKGVLVPVFIITVFVGLNLLFRKNIRYLPSFLIGAFLGILFSKILNPGDYFSTNPWKWGVGISLILMFFTWLQYTDYSRKKTILIIGTIIFTVISLSNSSRSLALIALSSTLVTLWSGFLTRTNIYNYFSLAPFGSAQLLVVGISTLYLADGFLVLLFTYQPFLELLPPGDAIKYSIQAQSDWGILLGGRSESIISLQAFIDSPIYGHGSWAENRNYVLEYYKLIDLAGSSLQSFEVMKQNIKSHLIPTHSHIMGALVWGGVVASLFWLYILRVIFKGFLNANLLESPLIVFASIYLVWNILFSPFGADARWLSTLLIWVYFTIIYGNRKKERL